MANIDILLCEALRKVSEGTMSFSPNGSSPTDLKKFQGIAKTIVYARDQGYIERVIASKDSTSGDLQYAEVLVIGGLTHKGERFLESISGSPTPLSEAFAEILDRFSSHSIQEKWEKALNRRITDPSGAITAARALLETTLKWIIEQRGGKLTDNNKELFNKAIGALGLEVKGKPIEKTIEGLNSIIWGIGEMRNKHGDAHGAASDAIPPTKREAGLCVNLAGAAAFYLLEEFESADRA
ncbi:MAG: hypothetical protein A3J24_04420 [Deltaproteobacteria bacterium RIFCSPLOWO2_02_FULL_53_8]|nr:MAG: hypothetical protein A3J24_04420 [Deltaproteobacteria bacterium RIFCSPLOWO2_02_FULL_53_8]